jgi:hypothetical protein
MYMSLVASKREEGYCMIDMMKYDGLLSNQQNTIGN